MNSGKIAAVGGRTNCLLFRIEQAYENKIVPNSIQALDKPLAFSQKKLRLFLKPKN
jgi:hypothetical protein